MPYPVVAETAFSAAGSSHSQSVPSGHQSGDLLLAIVYQDGGGTTFAGLASGWAFVSSPAQAAQNAQRTHVAWKAAASSSEADFTITGATDEWESCIIVIRGANTTNPFQVTPVRKSIASDGTFTSDTITTTATNCLIINAFGIDGPLCRAVPSDPGAMVYLGKSQGDGNGCLMVGYRNQISAGTPPTVSVQLNRTDGGTAWTIAIADNGSGNMGPDCRNPYEVVAYHGEYAVTQDTAITWSALTSIAGLTAATIDGIGVDTTDPETGVGNSVLLSSPDNLWNVNEQTSAEALSNLSHTVNLGADKWVGGAYLLPSTLDMRDRLFHVRIAINNYTSPFGAKGLIVVFEDTGGNWVAHLITQNTGLPGITNSSEACVIDHVNFTALASSGTMDWSVVRRIGYGMHRVAGSTNNRIIAPKDVFLLPHANIVGGCAASPISVAALEAMQQGWSGEAIYTQQGSGQGLPRGAIHFGDGSTKTYVDTASTSLEFPRPYAPSYKFRFWKVADMSLDVVVKASASCTMNLRGGVMATATKQAFTIDAASSASADYDFAGLVLVGWAVTHSATGITINEATFSGCRGITLNGGSLASCTISDTTETTAVTTNDPSEIADCEFISSGAGHAITITAPGTYSFVGNSFSGYGSDSTADAAIYNNSGGAVTLNISGGGGTPTVRNGAGASTTINNNVSITLDGVVVGSSIRVEKVSDGSLVEFRTATGTTEVFSVAGSVAYKIKVRKGTSATKYLPFDTQTASLSGDASIFVAQVADLIAA